MNDEYVSILPETRKSTGLNCAKSSKETFTFASHYCEIDAPEYQYLSDMSNNDKTWDMRKYYSQRQASFYEHYREFEKYAKRIGDCCGTLGFAFVSDKTTGIIRLKLQQAFFCHVRTCNQCEYRRSLMHRLRFVEKVPSFAQDYPKARWIFLTLTHKTCPTTHLKAELQAMSKAWGRFVKKIVFKDVIGWTRSVEVTRSKSDETHAHPHYHCLLMVRPGFFSAGYVSQAEWAIAWSDAMRLDYLPVVDVRACRDKKGGKLVSASDVDSMKSSVAEALKYSTKTSDLLLENEFDGAPWMLEYTRQIKGQKLLTSGGVLKGIFKQRGVTDEDLIHVEGEKPSEPVKAEDVVFFGYSQEKRRYRRKLKG